MDELFNVTVIEISEGISSIIHRKGRLCHSQVEAQDYFDLVMKEATEINHNTKEFSTKVVVERIY